MAESRLANLDNINLRIATDMEDYMRTANEVHEYSIKNKKAMRNPDGSPTTANADGLVVKDGQGIEFIATVPRYDPDLGRNLNDEEFRNKWQPLIQKGQIPVVPLKFDGEPSKHPARMWPKMNHDMDSYKPSRALKSIGYDYYKPPSLGN